MIRCSVRASALISSILVVCAAASLNGMSSLTTRFRGGANGDYSFSLTTFSSDGRLEQLESAMACVDQSPPVVAMKGSDCVVIVAVEPDLGPSVERSGTPKVLTISQGGGETGASCVVVAYSGIGADARALARAAQRRALAYSASLGEPMPPALVAAALADECQEATQEGGMRPYGVALVVAGCSPAEGAHLAQVETSGCWIPVKATAMGLGAGPLAVELAEKWRPGMAAHELEALGRDLLREYALDPGGGGDGAYQDDDRDAPSSSPLDAKPSPGGLGKRRWQASGHFTVAVVRSGSPFPAVSLVPSA